MPQYEWQVQLGFSEFWTLLFHKKRCPNCGTKLARYLAKHGTGPKWQRQGNWLNFRLWYGDKITGALVYRCEHCQLTFSLAQLRHGLPGVPTAGTTDAQLVASSDDQLTQSGS